MRNQELGSRSRLTKWKAINSGDMKIFVAHLIAMGLVRKSNLENFWAKNLIVNTPFFGKYMARNVFQAIHSNLHFVDNETADKTDPLYKLRPFVTMCTENFKRVYKCERELSFDESCCPWKGHLAFKVYNKSKANKFHIKIYQISEAKSGFITGFEIYTGRQGTSVADNPNTLDPDSNKTTRLVFGLLEAANCLDIGHRIYCDNYFSSCDLFQELYARKTFAAGTVNPKRRGMPIAFKAITKKTLERGEGLFRRNGELLAVKWMDKRIVTVLSTIHDANMVESKKDRDGNAVWKPEIIHQYCHYMGGWMWEMRCLGTIHF